MAMPQKIGAVPAKPSAGKYQVPPSALGGVLFARTPPRPGPTRRSPAPAAAGKRSPLGAPKASPLAAPKAAPPRPTPARLAPAHAQQKAGGAAAEAKRGGGRPLVPIEIIREVWAAEGGRCEACGMAMDQHVARVAKRDSRGPDAPANLALVCYDCASRHPAGWTMRTCVCRDPNILSTVPAPAGAEPLAWLRRVMSTHGVYVPYRRGRPRPDHRRVWVPGVGNVWLQRIPAPEGAPPSSPPVWEIVDAKWWPGGHLVPRPPQPRTRGLPRPDRSPRRPGRRPSRGPSRPR